MNLFVENINQHHHEFEGLMSSYEDPERYLSLVIDATYPNLEQALGYIKFCVSKQNFKINRNLSIFSNALNVIYRRYNTILDIDALYQALKTLTPTFNSLCSSFEKKKFFDIVKEAHTSPKKTFTQNYIHLLKHASQGVIFSREQFHAWQQCFGRNGVLTLMKILSNGHAYQPPCNESMIDFVALSLNQADKKDIDYLFNQCIHDHSEYLWPVVTSFLEEETVSLCSQNIQLSILMSAAHPIALTRLEDGKILMLISSILKTHPLNNLLTQSILSIASLMVLQQRGDCKAWLELLAKVYSRCSFSEWETRYEQWYEHHERRLINKSFQETRLEGYVFLLKQYFQNKNSHNKQALHHMTQDQLFKLTSSSTPITSKEMIAQCAQDLFARFRTRLDKTPENALILMNIALQSRNVFYPWIRQWLADLSCNTKLPYSEPWINLLTSLHNMLMNDHHLLNDQFYELAKIYVTLCFCTQKYFDAPTQSSYDEFLHYCQKIIDEVNIEFLQSNLCQRIIQIIPDLEPLSAPMIPLLEDDHPILLQNDEEHEHALPQHLKLLPWFERAQTYGAYFYKIAPFNIKAIMDMMILGSEMYADFKNHLHHQWELGKKEIELSDKINSWMDACQLPVHFDENMDLERKPHPSKEPVPDHPKQYTLASSTKNELNENQLQSVESCMTFSSHSQGATLSGNSFFTPLSIKTDSSEDANSLCNEYAASRR